MKIIKKSWRLVKPAKSTIDESFQLSIWDQIGNVMHVPTLYFYNPNQNSSHHCNIIDSLHTSLAKVLVHFYPVAGRLRRLDGGRLEINCNSAGVELLEVESVDTTLADLGDFLPSPELDHLFPCIDYKGTPLEEIPLLYVQLTKFKCGGISLGLMLSHVVADGMSAFHLVSEWARISRGKEDVLGINPILDRKVFKVAHNHGADHFNDCHNPYNNFLNPPVLIGETNNEIEKRKKTSTTILKLTKQQVETLKKKAAHNSNTTACMRYTRYEVVTAHTWRTACKARKLVKQQLTNLSTCVDIRKRVKPTLPHGYFGNAIVYVTASAYSGELLLSQPLAYAAGQIRAVVSQVTDEYVRSFAKLMENQVDISKFQDLYALTNGEGPFYGNPNMLMISWITLPMYDIDFGWGKEVFMGPGKLDGDGDCVIMPGHGDGDEESLRIFVCFQDCYIEEFKKFFYADI